MGTVAGMLDAMRALIGTAEEPPGSNHNMVTTWYGWDDAWCDMTVSYAAAQSDNADVVGKFAWTPAHAFWFKSHNRWHYGLGGARPGDVVFFDWSGSRVINNIDHVGVIEAVHSNGTITTIEGNTNDVCARRVRNGAVVVGYGRPAYVDAALLPVSDGILRLSSTGDAVRALQTGLSKIGLYGTVDGEFGPATDGALRAFQRKYGLEVDGEYGPATAAVLKAALAGAVVMLAGTAKPVPPRPVLAVDGEYGPATKRALQRYLNAHGARPMVTVDGEFGPASKRALQIYLGVKVDGTIGPNTVKALQHWVGSTVDGEWGPNTTKALQRKLNSQ